jgi:hypothetical protein
MPSYRFYSLDAAGQIMAESTIVDCPNDEAARESATTHAEVCDEVEIWQERRFVGRIRHE